MTSTRESRRSRCRRHSPRRHRRGAPRVRASEWRGHTSHRLGRPRTSPRRRSPRHRRRTHERSAGRPGPETARSHGLERAPRLLFCWSSRPPPLAPDPPVGQDIGRQRAISQQFRESRFPGESCSASSYRLVERARRRWDTRPRPATACSEPRPRRPAHGGTRRNPRRRRRTRRLFKHAERRSGNCREGEHRRLAPKDLGGGDRCPRHDLDLSVDARMIRVDLQEHIADVSVKRSECVYNDFDLPHVVDHRPRPPTAQRILSTAGRRALLARARRLPTTPARSDTAWFVLQHTSEGTGIPAAVRGHSRTRISGCVRFLASRLRREPDEAAVPHGAGVLFHNPVAGAENELSHTFRVHVCEATERPERVDRVQCGRVSRLNSRRGWVGCDYIFRARRGASGLKRFRHPVDSRRSGVVRSGGGARRRRVRDAPGVDPTSMLIPRRRVVLRDGERRAR